MAPETRHSGTFTPLLGDHVLTVLANIRRFASLPELYRWKMLHAVPKEAVPDSAYLIVTPALSGSLLSGRGKRKKDKCGHGLRLQVFFRRHLSSNGLVCHCHVRQKHGKTV